MPLKKVVLIVGLIILLVLGYEGWIWSRTQWIPAGYVGLIYDARGGLQPRPILPRAVYVGWRQQIYIYPTRLEAAIYTQDPDEGEVRAADGIQITTNDNANTVFDVAVFYRVRPEDVVRVFNSFGPLPIEEIQVQHIRRAIKEVVNVVGPRYSVFDLMGPKRQEASELATNELRARLAPKGITVETVMLGSCYPTPDVEAKITQRVNSLTDLEISRLKSQLADIEKATALVKAAAESQARKVTASQVQGKSIEMLRLETDEAALRKWNGQLPLLESKPGQTIVLDREALNGGLIGRR